jgi:hypothetical protein
LEIPQNLIAEISNAAGKLVLGNKEMEMNTNWPGH